jgi:hypothetical protein
MLSRTLGNQYGVRRENFGDSYRGEMSRLGETKTVWKMQILLY